MVIVSPTIVPTVRVVQKKVRPLRVLVVDDHEGIREIVSAYLAEDRHIVETAASAKEAMEKFRAHRFDLVITDLRLPDGDGMAITRALYKAQPALPIIMMTSYSSLDTAIVPGGCVVR